MNIFSHIACILFICLGGFFFGRAEVGMAIATWLIAILYPVDALIVAIQKGKP